MKKRVNNTKEMQPAESLEREVLRAALSSMKEMAEWKGNC